VDFKVTGQLMIIHSAFVKYLSKNGNTMRQRISYLQTPSKPLISVNREILYNTLIQFAITMNLVSIIKMCLNEMYGRARVGKHLSDTFLVKNGLKQGDILWLLLFNFPL
jgi:hypothetical protein